MPVGEVIAILEVSEETKSTKPKTDVASSTSTTLSASSVEKSQKKKETKKPKQVKPVSNSFSVSNSNTFFSPLIISIAKDHHISFEELARIPATGNEGRLRKSDVFHYIEEGRPFKFAQPVAEPDPTAYRLSLIHI